MVERFSREARAVVAGAADAARRAGAERVHTGHMLLALAADPGPAGRALAAVGVTADRVRGELVGPGGADPAGVNYEQVRRAVDAEFGPGSLERAVRRGGRGQVRLAAEAKQALGRGLRQAVAGSGRRIGAEHLLLGLLGDPASVGARYLARSGVDLAALRADLGGEGPAAGRRAS